MPLPEIDLDEAKVEIVRLKHLIEFNGTKENPVRGIHLQGLTFKHTARTFMENKEQLRPLTREERKFSEENYHLIMDFMKKSKLDAEEFFDIVVFDFPLSVEKYLNDPQLQAKCSFEAVSYMYMKRAVFVHFRKQKAQKRSTEAGSDISLDSMDMNISNHSTMETASNLEYREMVKQIENGLTEEQKKIFSDKVEGYSLKEIADNHGIKQKRVYKQFDKVKRIVTEVMEV